MVSSYGTFIPTPTATNHMPIAAIDGHAAAGKSEASRRLAALLKGVHLNSGTIYRSITWLAKDQAGSLQLALLNRVTMSPEGVCIDGTPVTSEITESQVVKDRVSTIAKHPEVRARAHALLLDASNMYVELDGPTLIVEGRDMGSVVFKDTAMLKIFLTASPLVRAQRAMKRMTPDEASLSGTLAEVLLRDFDDETRAESPLIKVRDAIEVDTSELDEIQTVETIATLWHSMLARRKK